MSGNRNRQRAFEPLILLEMAACGGSIDARRSRDIPPLQGRILSYFKFSQEELAQRYKRGQPAVPHDILYAADELEGQRRIKRKPYVSWDLEPSGIVCLRDFLNEVLRAKAPSTTVEQIMLATDSDGEEILLWVLKNLPASHLGSCVHDSPNLQRLFQRAVFRLPNKSLFTFCAKAYRALKPSVALNLARKHRLIANI